MGWLHSYIMLLQLNVTMKLSNVSKKKKKELLNVIKVQSYMILVLPNVTIELSNMRKKFRVSPNMKKYG